MINLGKESEFIEFKETTAELDKACKALVAMLNKHGHGTIYFGVKDNGDIIGQQIGNKTLSDIADKINSSIKPTIYPSIVEMKIDDKSIIKVDFIGNNMPYSYKGAFYIRMGDENSTLDPQQILKIMKESNQYNDLLENELTEYSEKDISEEDLDLYYRQAVAMGRISKFEYSPKELLKQLNLLKDDKLTRAGYYLFGKNGPIIYKCVDYPTTERIDPIDLKRYEGNVFNLIDKVLNFIYDKIRWKVVINDIQRKEIPEVPVAALREIVINSLIHADFNDSTQNQITIDPEEIEIYNPGAFMDDLTPNDYINGNLASHTRHNVIQNVIYKAFDIETLGRGLKRMDKICKENNVDWKYRMFTTGFSMIFKRTDFKSNDSNTTYNQKNESQLSLNAMKLLEKLKTTNGLLLSIEEASNILNLKERATFKTITELVNTGHITRIGSNKNGYWKVNK